MKDAKDEVILKLISVIEAYRKITRTTGLDAHPSVKSLDELASEIINIVKK